MKKGYFDVCDHKDYYAIIDGVKYSFKEYKDFTRQLLYMMIMDGNTPACMLDTGQPIGRKIDVTVRVSSARILRAAGWKRIRD